MNTKNKMIRQEEKDFIILQIRNIVNKIDDLSSLKRIYALAEYLYVNK